MLYIKFSQKFYYIDQQFQSHRLTVARTHKYTQIRLYTKWYTRATQRNWVNCSKTYFLLAPNQRRIDFTIICLHPVTYTFWQICVVQSQYDRISSC